MKLLNPVKIDTTVLVATNVTEAETLWAIGTTYAADDAVYKVIAGIHQGFKSNVGANTGHDPETDDLTHWTPTGATGPWKMFDQAIQSPTTFADTIAVQLQLPATEFADSVWLGNLNARSLHIAVLDPIEGLVRNLTYDLKSNLGIVNLWRYFFGPPRRRRDIFVTGLGAYAGATLSITLDAAGETVKCGEVVVGYAQKLGGTKFAPQLGIRDYSLKTENDFGDLVVVERAYRKTGDFQVIVDSREADFVCQTLADFRAKPILMVGDDGFASMAIFGFLQDWKLEVTTRRVSFLSLQLASLT